MSRTSPTPDPESRRSIRQQLEKILGSNTFAHSERMTRFLRFTVECSLDGRAGELKEYLLGVEVFDRKQSYDPRVDPIVRVEARRLRAKLNKYYETEGRADPFIIEFPTGGYVPRFRQHGAAPATPARLPHGNTIAVLPFTNLSPDPDNEYFSDGLTEELIHALTKIPELCVVAWNSASQLKAAHDPYAIGEQLKVSTVLMGSVRRAGHRVRIVAQLIETATGHYLWSETYDRQMQDLLAIQEEISRAIAQKLTPRLPPAGTEQKSAYNIEAYNLYLKGRFHWNKRTTEGLKRSVQLFEEAVVRDPNFALGYAGLADAFSLLADYGVIEPARVMPKAKAAASKALELNPKLSEAHASLALIRSLYDWEWEEAERGYRRAIELNPGYVSAHHWYGVDYLAMLGRFQEAHAEIELARQLDPLSTIIREGVGLTLLLERRYDEAIAQYRECLDLDSFFYKAYTSMGRAYTQKGMYTEAIEMLQKGRSLAGDIPNILGALGQTCALAGRTHDARRYLEELAALARHRYVPRTCIALIHAGLGENQIALDVLEQGVESRELTLAGLKTHPAYDSLRGEPGFARLLRRIGLSSPPTEHRP